MLNLDHVVFPVWDAEASLDFYAETLGLPLIGAITGDDWGGKAWLMMAFGLGGGRELVLVALRGAERPAPDGLAPDTRHYAFSVASEAERSAWRARLERAGVAFWEEDHGDQQSIYFPDPNGVIIEITTPASSAGTVADAEAMRRARGWIAATTAERALTT
ncbi:MAG TPA: VOC family protein [Caulobacteraceae bacterium]|jgi:glyoxylase I family protein